MKKILVTAVGGDIGYGVVKALRKCEKDLYIVGCDIRKYNVSYELVDKFLLCPPYSDVQGWLSFMGNVVAEEEVDMLWPITEPEIRILMDCPKLFEKISIVMNESNVLDIALDKEKTASFLSSNGVLTPKTWEDTDSSDITYPAIVKERSSCGSHAVKIAANKEQMKSYYEKMEAPIVQEYVGDADDEYTLTVFSDDKVINYIAFKRELGFGGMSRCVELVDDPALADVADKIARMFKLRGSVNVQMRKKDDDYCVFEINPRISSTVGFRDKLGFHDVQWWIDMLKGKDIPKYIYPKGKVYGVRSVEEILFTE